MESGLMNIVGLRNKNFYYKYNTFRKNEHHSTDTSEETI